MDPKETKLLDRLEGDLLRFSKLHLWYQELSFEGKSYLIFPWKGQQPKNHFDPQVKDSENLHWWLYPASFIDEVPVSGYGKEIVMQNPVILNCFLRGVEKDGTIKGWHMVKCRTPKLKSSLQKRYPHINSAESGSYVTLEFQRQLGNATKSAYKIYVAMTKKSPEWLEEGKISTYENPSSSSPPTASPLLPSTTLLPTPPLFSSSSPPSFSHSPLPHSAVPLGSHPLPIISSSPFSYHKEPPDLQFSSVKVRESTPSPTETLSGSSSSKTRQPSTRMRIKRLSFSFSKETGSDVSPRWKKKASFSPRINRYKEDSPKKKIPLLKFPFRDDSRESPEASPRSSSPEEIAKTTPSISPTLCAKGKYDCRQDKPISSLKYEVEKKNESFDTKSKTQKIVKKKSLNFPSRVGFQDAEE